LVPWVLDDWATGVSEGDVGPSIVLALTTEGVLLQCWDMLELENDTVKIKYLQNIVGRR
jgi:hypothetical protein